MSAADIIKELAKLSPEELRAIQLKLNELVSAQPTRSNLPRIASPRLVEPTRAKEFQKHVTELPGHASV